jgi:Zn-dependent protease with chaperone function
MFVSSIFVWLFVAVSLILCLAFTKTYEYQLQAGVREVFGRAILIAIGSGIPLSIVVRQLSPRIILGKAKGLHLPAQRIVESLAKLADQMGVPAPQMQLSADKVPISFAVHTKKPTIVMSESLLSLLKQDEVEAVMAHELAHIRNSDTALKALATAYKTVLPFDPIVRLVEAAFHREREMVADETAAKATRKPLSLASALLKIYEAFPKNSLPSYGTLSILGAGSSLMSRHPPIRDRINQLIRLADIYG